MKGIKEWLRLLWQLARKVNSGKATDEEARQYDYDLMLMVCGLCVAGIVVCIVMSHVITSLRS